MRNWLKNLLFVLFSFVFLGVGILIANILIHEKGNPLKDPNFLADASTDSTTLISLSPVDSTEGWVGDSVPIIEPSINTSTPKLITVPVKESSSDNDKRSKNYDVVIGIFKERSNAKRQVEKLREIGYNNAYIYTNLSMIVVSAGQFDKTHAQKIASDLNKKGFDAIVKRK